MQRDEERGPRLLVSVRDSAEACEAVIGGAAIVDIKDPARGALGAAIDVWPEVLRVARVVECSAAMGELGDWESRALPEIPLGLTWLKFGLAHQAERPWRAAWRSLCRRLPGQIKPVVVAYADWSRCGAPSLAEVAAFAFESDVGLLIDTCDKSAGVLWDYVSRGELSELTRRAHRVGCAVAVAGSLDLSTIGAAASSGCDWVAVRGAACESGRLGQVRAHCVRRLRRALLGNSVEERVADGR